MRRIRVPQRKNLSERAVETGFTLLEIDGAPYWDESAYYGFTLEQIETHIEDATAELEGLCRELAARAAGDERMLGRMQIPEHAWSLVAESWRRGDFSLYGRFDLAYDGASPARLLEYNADTPTSLFEASVFQWLWLEDSRAAGSIPPEADQFNAIHETLIARFGELKKSLGRTKILHLACEARSEEDRGLVDYLADCASQAGFEAYKFALEHIGDRGKGPFVDLDNAPVTALFKLYPWEWMLADPFARSPSMRSTLFIEPPWKAMLSNKAILPLLWDMAPRHPNLLPAYFEDDPRRASIASAYARKPVHSREGANVTLVRDGTAVESAEGSYGGGGYVWQALATMPAFDGNTPVIGSWIIGGKACGMGIREDVSAITRNTSRFVPHAILP
jgi:glutathionylspermidine synthase